MCTSDFYRTDRHCVLHWLEHVQIIYVEMDALKWRGFPPKIFLQYDEETAFLLQATFYLNRLKTRLSSQEVFKMFIEDLALAKVITTDQSKEIIMKTRSVVQQAAQASGKN